MGDGSALGSSGSMPVVSREDRGGHPGAGNHGPAAAVGLGPLPCAAPDALIEELSRLQATEGFLSRQTLEQVALQMRLPFSHVYGVASFYHLFLLERPTPHRCGVCLGSACFLRGAMGLVRQLAARLQVELDDPAGNGLWSLQRLGCLGACGQAPVLVVDGQLFTRLPLEDGPGTRLEGRLQQAGLPAAASESGP